MNNSEHSYSKLFSVLKRCGLVWWFSEKSRYIWI